MYYPPQRRRDWHLFARENAEQAADEYELDEGERAHLVLAWSDWAAAGTLDHEPDDWDEYLVWLGRKAVRRLAPLGAWALFVALFLAVAPIGGGEILPIVLILLAAVPLFGSLAVSAALCARRVEMYKRSVTRAYEIMRRDPGISFDAFCGEMGRTNVRHFVRHRGEQALGSYWRYYSEWQGPKLVEPVAA